MNHFQFQQKIIDYPLHCHFTSSLYKTPPNFFNSSINTNYLIRSNSHKFTRSARMVLQNALHSFVMLFVIRLPLELVKIQVKSDIMPIQPSSIALHLNADPEPIYTALLSVIVV